MFKPKAIYFEKEIKNYELGKKLLEKYKEVPKVEIENHNNIEEMRKKQNKEFIKNVYSSGSKEYFLKFAYKQTNLLIINFIEKEYNSKIMLIVSIFMLLFNILGIIKWDNN